MARIAVITDVHGNLPALRATLAAADDLGCDAVVHTGDAVGIGPFPAECLDLLVDRCAARATMGNHDALLVAGESAAGTEEDRHHAWVRAAVPGRLRERVAAWPYVLPCAVEGVRVVFAHYGLGDDGTSFRPIVRGARPADLDLLFEGVEADVVFYGHHHPASDLVGAARYVNPGSAGCQPLPLARFALLECARGSYTVEHRAVPYDDDVLRRAFADRAVPAVGFLHRAFYGNRWA